MEFQENTRVIQLIQLVTTNQLQHPTIKESRTKLTFKSFRNQLSNIFSKKNIEEADAHTQLHVK